MTSQPTHPSGGRPTLLRAAGAAYFPIAFVARFPFAMMVVGTLTLVVSARGSIALGGLNSAVVGLGSALIGPLLGAAADRIGQRPVILLSGVVTSLSLIAMSWVAFSSLPDLAVLAVGFVIGASSPQIGPLSRSRLVHLILTRLPSGRRAKSLNATMGYESAADETAFVFGPVVVGALATTMTAAAPMIGAAVLTLVFVTAFALHPTARVSAPAHDEPVTQAPARELRSLRVLVIVAGALGVGLFFGTVLTSLTAFLSEVGRGDSAGLVYGIMGVGSTILALGISLFPEGFSLRWRWLAFSSLMLAAMLAFGLAGGLTGVAAAMAVAGIGIGPTVVTLYSLAAERSPQGRSATVMTMLGSATIVGQSLASAITGGIAERIGAQGAMWLPTAAAALVVLTALVNAFARRTPGATEGVVTGQDQEVQDEAAALVERPVEHL
ncbi:MFS transporter [Brachybacterium endophyticum]|uniref:MFS transporter n=1 Tax=Brachybacterium endophyticum TaxID=2182385 RepID=A0A2U2RJW8_9MICO|nr:MFS transporter [Brachybacterium endophyticum]PWH06074.1 MFS transporter [Brachybacterium endophyticum]